MADVVEVAQAFETYGFTLDDNSDVAAQCLAICRQFQASADDLAISWDAFYSSNALKIAANPTSSAMEAFRAHFERHVATNASKSNKTPQRFYYGKPDLLETIQAQGTDGVDATMMDVNEVDASIASVTPGRGGHTPGAKTAAAKAAHAQATRFTGVQLPRTDAGATLAAMAPAPGTSAYAKRPAPRAAKTELNPTLPKRQQQQTNDKRGSLAAAAAVNVIDAAAAAAATKNNGAAAASEKTEPLERDVRYMRDRISDKVEMLETRLGDFAAEVERTYPGLNCGGAVYAASQDDVTVVGRVVCDSEGKLNEASVQLEGSIATSNGMRVRLELRDLPRFSLFPGQIVCVQGQNPSGHCLVARRVIAALPPPMTRSPVSSPAFGALSAVVASGPFTCAGDLSYEPFSDLLAYAMDTKPDVLVLMGPFVDAEHRIIRGEDVPSSNPGAGGGEGGPLDVSFEEVFAWGVRDRLEAFTSAADAAGYAPAVVLMPSVRDATHDAVFPQPPLLSDGAVEAPRSTTVVCAPNPGTFTVNGVRITACTQDVLRHLSAAEAAREPAAGGAAAAGAPGPSDRMSRLAAHLPGQRSAYPLFPPAAGACMDAALSSHLAMDATPDLLLLPSDLNPFAKVVSSQRGAVSEAAEGVPPLPAAAAGTAAATEEESSFVALNPGRLAKGNIGGTLAHVYISEGAPDPSAGGAQPHALHKRARVDIVRI